MRFLITLLTTLAFFMSWWYAVFVWGKCGFNLHKTRLHYMHKTRLYLFPGKKKSRIYCSSAAQALQITYHAERGGMKQVIFFVQDKKQWEINEPNKFLQIRQAKKNLCKKIVFWMVWCPFVLYSCIPFYCNSSYHYEHHHYTIIIPFSS